MESDRDRFLFILFQKLYLNVNDVVFISFYIIQLQYT